MRTHDRQLEADAVYWHLSELQPMKSKLTNSEINALDDITTNLAASREAVEAVLLDYRAVLERSRNLRDDIVSRLTTFFERKSERFRDSRDGDEMAHFIASWGI